MDPNMALQLFREAYAAEDFETAAQHAKDLDEWISMQGFLPDVWKPLTRVAPSDNL